METEFKYLSLKTIKKFVNGDTKAREEVYEKYETHVYRIVAQFSNDPVAIHRLVNEIFISINRNRKQLKDVEALFLWLSNIAYRICIKEYNIDTKYYPNIHEGGFPEESFFDQEKSKTIDSAYLKRAQAIMRKRMDEMKPEWKITAYLRFFEQLSVKEIASIMEIPPKSIVSKLSGIKLTLREKLQEEKYPSEMCKELLVLPNMIELYEFYIESLPLPIKKFEETPNTVKRRKVKMGNKEKPLFLLIGVTAIILLFALAALMGSNSSQLLGNYDKAKITSVEFETGWSKQPLKITVNTSSDEYDDIQIDGKTYLSVSENGEHRITLLKEDKVIDQKMITITNVDMKKPNVINEEVSTDGVTLTLKDTDSGIDFYQIKLKEGTLQKDDITIDREYKKIFIKKEIARQNILSIPDIAGNVLEINMKY